MEAGVGRNELKKAHEQVFGITGDAPVEWFTGNKHATPRKYGYYMSTWTVSCDFPFEGLICCFRSYMRCLIN